MRQNCGIIMRGYNDIYNLIIALIHSVPKKRSPDFAVNQLLRCIACTCIIRRLLWSLSDYRLIRRLEFRADYPVLCKHINDKATKSLVMNTAEANYQQIEQICGNGMFVIKCRQYHLTSLLLQLNVLNFQLGGVKLCAAVG